MNKKTVQLSQYYTDLYKRAMFLATQSQYREAIDMMQELLNLGPRESAAYIFTATCYVTMADYRGAIDVLCRGILKSPDDPELYRLRSFCRYALSENDAGLAELSEAIEKFPDNERLVLMRSVMVSRSETGTDQDAIDLLNELLEKNPDNYEAILAKATLLGNMEDYVGSTECLLKVLRKKPDYVPAIVNMAQNMVELKDVGQAIKFYDAAIKINPEYGLGLCNKAALMCTHGLAQEYIGLLEKGIEKLKKDKRDFNAYLIYLSNYIFYIHYVPHEARQKIFDVIKSWQELACRDQPVKARSSFSNDTDTQRKLRIGLISYSYTRHPVTWMTLAAIQNIDRTQFELVCYSDVNPKKNDDITKRYYDLCDEVHELIGISNDVVIEKIRDDKIDILLELTGHSEGGRRMPVSAARVAPVQVKWVGGLFDTTGVPAMDWILGDKIEIPEGDEKWYTERVYRMPDDYIVYEPPTYVSGVKPLPALKNGYVTFSNMNNLAKTNAFTVALWSRVLKAVPRSRLLMKVSKIDTPFARQHFEQEFARHGIGIDRLIFEGGEPHKIFMEAYNRVDIALDPYPYSGGLSTCEALWMGAPVIALPGETFAGRHAATHLYHAGLEDWIAKDEDDYVAIAARWANDLEGLARLRAGLREQVGKSPLCDGPRFARNFEKALRFMWKDWCDEKLAAEADTGKASSKAIKPLKPKKSKKKK